MCLVLAAGRSPCSVTARCEAINGAAAPSAIWLDSAAVTTPPSFSSRNETSPAIAPSEVSLRGHSSARTSPYGSISAAKSPASVAAIARWWLASA